MELQTAQDAYKNLSGKLSDINRQLCFAGIAVVWIFAVSNESGSYRLPNTMLVPLGAFVTGLLFDLLQYVVSTIIYGTLHRSRERKNFALDEDIKAPAFINWPAVACLIVKVGAVLVGYVALLFAVLYSGAVDV
ncbi:hypothetical protein SSPSH_002227 [Salinisphaera shabanensis E1L3A]|uniref:Uncharacterized protein n=1 Tax=Salinisphaera shabanensis E1L3A TaxID=1033802 RepID=U2FRN1_9GAMM|nr:hypothetical protein [Salinisphaera shabanensis]ERJ18734.1 hypothetical protein SSPSH_002227 [Salinisphaera shabanensis E1L3A]